MESLVSVAHARVGLLGNPSDGYGGKAIALAIASARREKALDPHLAAIGEISLAGEIRAVAGAPQRAAEGARLGYTTLVDASAVHVREAVRLAFASAADEPAGIPEF